MSSDHSLRLDEIDLVERCLGGEQDAIRSLQTAHAGYLQSVLSSYGASAFDAEDTVATLWADCVVAQPGREALFQKYNGKSALRSWLTAIVINRWLSQRRRHAVRMRAQEHLEATFKSHTAPDRDTIGDPELLAVLESAVRQSCAACNPEEVVILQLVHLHNLTQREIAAIWGWHESRVSRLLTTAEEKISQRILQTLAAFDPMLNLQWSDVLRLCECTNLLLFQSPGTGRA